MSKSVLPSVLRSARYRGKPVLVVGQRVFVPRKGQKISDLWGELEKRYPNQTPVYVHLPKGSLVVISWR